MISDTADEVPLLHAHLDDVDGAAYLILKTALPLDETLRRLAVAHVVARVGSSSGKKFNTTLQRSK